MAASERQPAHVVGDGVHTVADLIELANQDPRRGEGHEKPLTCLTVDAIALACLQRHGLSLDTVPATGQTVWLRDTANLSTGGTATDVTDLAHPQTRRMCERVARFVGLYIRGLDLVTRILRFP